MEGVVFIFKNKRSFVVIYSTRQQEKETNILSMINDINALEV